VVGGVVAAEFSFAAGASMMTVRVVVDPVGDSAESGEAGLVGDDVGDGVGVERCGHRCDWLREATSFFAGTPIQSRQGKIRPFHPLAVRTKFIRCNFDLLDNYFTFPEGSGFTSCPEAQPHFVVTWKSCHQERPEDLVIVFRNGGGVFDAHGATWL
jgi:hypothetical protein